MGQRILATYTTPFSLFLNEFKKFISSIKFPFNSYNAFDEMFSPLEYVGDTNT